MAWLGPFQTPRTGLQLRRIARAVLDDPEAVTPQRLTRFVRGTMTLSYSGDHAEQRLIEQTAAVTARNALQAHSRRKINHAGGVMYAGYAREAI